MTIYARTASTGLYICEGELGRNDLVLENEAVARLALLHVADGGAGLLHRAGRDPRLDVVLGRELEQLVNLGRAADKAAGEGERLADELLHGGKRKNSVSNWCRSCRYRP